MSRWYLWLLLGLREGEVLGGSLGAMGRGGGGGFGVSVGEIRADLLARLAPSTLHRRHHRCHSSSFYSTPLHSARSVGLALIAGITESFQLHLPILHRRPLREELYRWESSG